MNRILKRTSIALAGIAIAGSALMATPAMAGPVQLGFILDRSGSIGASNWNIIRTGLANAIGSLVPLGGQYEISVVTFASTASIDIANFLVTDAASRSALAAQIASLAYTAGGTNFGAAFNAMNDALDNTIANASFSYINFATDGLSASGPAERNASIALGVDNISVEGIGSGVNANFLKQQICYPGPCDDSAPYNFPTQGFYIGVADAQGYADAIGNKIKTITQVPEPASLALVGLGLVVAGATRRRRG